MLLFHISFQTLMTAKLFLDPLVLMSLMYHPRLIEKPCSKIVAVFANYELLLLWERVCILVCICYLILQLARSIEIGLVLD